MSKKRFNQFTRGVFLAFSVLMLGLIVDLSKAVALHSQPAHVQAKVLSVPSIEANGVHRISVLPNRPRLLPGLPPGAATLTDYRVDTRLQGNVATTTITQTYHLTPRHPHRVRHWFFALVGAKVSKLMGHQTKGQDLSQATSAKTG